MPAIIEPPRALDFIVSEANGFRSRDRIVLGQVATAIPLQPGTLLYVDAGSGNYMPATVAEVNNIAAILMYSADITGGLVEAAAITRDAEVNQAYLLYNESTAAGAALPVAAANAALALKNIVVRPAVLPTSLVAPPVAP